MANIYYMFTYNNIDLTLFAYLYIARHEHANNNPVKYTVVVKGTHITVCAPGLKSGLWALTSTSSMTKIKLFNFSNIFFLICKRL